MLRKLLKYDLRSNMKIYRFLWPCIVIATVLQWLLLPNEIPDRLQEFLIPLVIMLLLFSIIGSIVASMVICIDRFYKGLLKDEGYLMFTLPVHPWEIVLSKLLISMLTIGVTVLLSFGSMYFFIGGIFSEGDLQEVLSAFSELFENTGAGRRLLNLVNLILNQALSILLIYLSCTVGHLAKKHRVVASVGAYFAINYGLQFLSALLTTLIGGEYAWFTTLSTSVFAALCFYFTQLILEKRLNLE